MAKAQRDLQQDIVNVLFENGPTSAQDLMGKLGLQTAQGPEVAAIVKGLRDGGYVVQDKNLFDLSATFRASADGSGDEAQEAVEGFEDLTVEFDEAPAQAPAPAPAKKAASKAPAKQAATKAQPKAQAPAAQDEDEDEGFNIPYKSMDTLTLAELTQRANVAQAAAEANWNTGNKDNQLVAEVLMRWVARAGRRIRNMQKQAQG